MRRHKLFYLTFIPYLIFIIYCIYSLITGANSNSEHIFKYIINTLTNSLANVEEFLMFDNRVLGFLLVIIIIYHIWCIVGILGNKLKNTFLIISILSWGTYFIYCFQTYFTGFSFLFHTSYGWEAVASSLLIVLIYFSLIPILPITLIYIIFYIIKSKK